MKAQNPNKLSALTYEELEIVLRNRVSIKEDEFYVKLPNGRTVRFDYHSDRDPIAHTQKIVCKWDW